MSRSLLILGAGQLGRMLGLAAIPLGVRVLFVDPAADSPAAAVGEQLAVSYDDPLVLARARDVDVVSFEFENVPETAVRRLAEHVVVRPGPQALAIAQDRIPEKDQLNALAIPTAPYAAVDSQEALEAAVARLGLPAILKTRRLGYDGKGQRALRSSADVPGAFLQLGGVPAILEGFVRFRRELSQLTVRALDGSFAHYPLVENVHSEGILHVTRAPAPNVSDDAAAAARGYTERLLTALDYVGVAALELFELHDGTLVANELAPRVHNSGHWTIEGAETSQFENHVRAVLGLPLGAPTALGPCAMVNVVGEEPPLEALLALPGVHVHRYDKAPRRGRKLAHVTVRARTDAELDARLAELCRLIAPPSAG